MTRVLVIVLLVGAVAMGGYVLNHQMTCTTLQEDYLNTFSEMRNSAALYGMRDAQIDQIAKDSEGRARQNLERLTREIYTRCGERAMRSAVRKAGDTIAF